MLGHLRVLVDKFFSARGTQLAAMVAYYALLSFVPLCFLAVATLGLVGSVDAESALVQRISEIFPGAPVDQIVSAVNGLQGSSASLGLIGGAFLLWSALGLFGALQSAFNIVWGRPNASFVRGKGLAAGAATILLATVVVGLVATTLFTGLVRELIPGELSEGNVSLLLSLLAGTGAGFLLLTLAYRHLTNAPLRYRDAMPGGLLAAAALQVTFLVVPLFVRLTGDSLAVQMLGSTALLLLWFYLMAAILVFGQVVNWWVVHALRGGSETVEEDVLVVDEHEAEALQDRT